MTKNTLIKKSILELIDLKFKTVELISSIYHNSDDVKLCIYSENPITIFVEAPRGFELLASIFKKRILTSTEKLKGEYSIKKYFCYRDVEFFCLYRNEKNKRTSFNKNKLEKWSKIIKIFGSILTILKTIGIFGLSILKFVIK